MKFTLLVCMFVAFQLKGAKESSAIIPLPPETQEQLVKLIDPVAKKLIDELPCEKIILFILVTPNPVALRIEAKCVEVDNGSKVQLLPLPYTRN